MSEKEKKICRFKSKIGGQALIEGVMMRGIDKSAMAVRLPNGSIDVEVWDTNNGKNAPWYKKTPFVRGVFNFVSSMVEGYKCLSKSADKAMQGIEDDEEPSKFEKWITEKLGDKFMGVLMGISMVFGVVLALALFIFLPSFITKLFSGVLEMSDFVKTLIEGLLKIVIFALYIGLTGLMKDIRRTYEYHGAEHKTIACYEACEDMTVENVRKHSRFHPRCGTSFIFLVIFISILLNVVLQLPWENIMLRVVIKLLLLPVVMGITYEIIKIAGRYDNPVTKVISAPGLWLQRLTTREPDDSQIEVALASFLPVVPDDKSEDKW